MAVEARSSATPPPATMPSCPLVCLLHPLAMIDDPG
jgi:hypothetical protein